MQIRKIFKLKLRKHDSKTKFNHDWQENWRGTITSRWSGIGRKEVRILGFHGCFCFPRSSLYELTPSQNLDWSDFFVSQPSHLTVKNLDWYILKRKTFFHCHTLQWHYRLLDHPRTSSRVRCGRPDALLPILLATLTHMPPFQPFSRYFKGLHI